jgi:dTDP-4-amino-4,6-dideoxygalactose transaminase
LSDSIVVDQDDELGGPSIKELERIVDEIDGIIVTNPFGLQTAICAYEAWCKDKNLLLFFDNAATAVGFVDDGRCIHDAGDGAFISLHETKPIGRGEGGAVFVSEELYPHILCAINFGFSPVPGKKPGVCREGNRTCSNWRMSDIAAAAILCHLCPTVIGGNWTARYTELLSYAANLGASLGVSLQPPPPAGRGLRMVMPTIVSCLFISVSEQWRGKVGDLIERLLSSSDGAQTIEAKQYYRPLAERAAAPLAWRLFDSTICLPFHLDMRREDVRYMIEQVKLAFGENGKEEEEEEEDGDDDDDDDVALQRDDDGRDRDTRRY